MRANTKKKHEMGRRFAIVIGVAAAGVMALGAQTALAGGESVDSTPPDLQLSGPKKQSPQKTAGAKKGCGIFQGFTGPRSTWRVVVNRGKVSCNTAGWVMRQLFRKGPNRRIGKWDCIGPQTGFARCDYGNRRITTTEIV